MMSFSTTLTPTKPSLDSISLDSIELSHQPLTVRVTLLLMGGHEQTVVLDRNSPLLKDLFLTLQRSPEQKQQRFFQIPHRPDNSSHETALCFTGDRLVGLMTDPPLYVNPPAHNPWLPRPAAMIPAPIATQPTPHAVQPQPLTIQREHPEINTPEVVETPEGRQIMASPKAREEQLPQGVTPSRYIQVTNFFSPEELQQLVDYTVQRQGDFVGSTVTTNTPNHRASKVLHHFPEFADKVRVKIRDTVPDLTRVFQIPSFPITDVEAQLTAHNDGNFYKMHNDNGSEGTSTRVLTYVYYYYREPKAFSGGELRLYDSRIENNFYGNADSFQDVEPINNSVVFFLSHYMHEVRPVVCPSQKFEDSRFTINGWVRR